MSGLGDADMGETGNLLGAATFGCSSGDGSSLRLEAEPSECNRAILNFCKGSFATGAAVMVRDKGLHALVAALAARSGQRVVDADAPVAVPAVLSDVNILRAAAKLMEEAGGVHVCC